MNGLKFHETSFQETTDFIITDKVNSLGGLQVKKAELYRKQMVDRVGKRCCYGDFSATPCSDIIILI